MTAPLTPAESTLDRFAQPAKVDALDMAFGGAMKNLLPPYAELPEEFRREWHEGCRIAQMWFFSGLAKPYPHPQTGIDADAAFRHMRAIMASWEPKHEHKIAGVGYLLDRWFVLDGYEAKPAKGAA